MRIMFLISLVLLASMGCSKNQPAPADATSAPAAEMVLDAEAPVEAAIEESPADAEEPPADVEEAPEAAPEPAADVPPTE